MTNRRAFCAALAALPAAPSCRAQAAWPTDDPAPAGAPVPDGWFGMHVHRLAPAHRGPGAIAWPADASIGALRLWDCDTRWADVAPARGAWDFERLDAIVAQAAARRVPVLYTLGSTPRWASARPDEAGPYGPGCAAEPARLADWDEYVRRVAARYRGAIEAYELWNEPNFSDVARDRGAPGFYTGPVGAMVEMARAARAAIAALDPAARLLTPGFTNGPDRLALFLDAGGAPLVDGVAYHFYSADSARFIAQVAEVREVMRRRGLATLPLWNTECGVDAGTLRGDASLAGAKLAQFLLLGAALGLARFHYYAWDDGHSGMTGADAASRARAAAWTRTTAWLRGAALAPPRELAGGALHVAARRDGERFDFLWSARDDESPACPVSDAWRVAAVEPLFETQDVPRALPARLSPQPLRVRRARDGQPGDPA
jgi:hypothetical protein